MLQWEIREMRREHLEQVMHIERKSFPTPWTRGMFLYELHSPISICLVATAVGKRKEEILGYVIFCVVKGEVHILNLATLPSFRRMGIARSLFLHTLHLSYQKGGVVYFLEVRKGNQAAINLYRRVGFAPWAVRKGYYGDTGEDAIIMRLFCGGRLFEPYAPDECGLLANYHCKHVTVGDFMPF